MQAVFFSIIDRVAQSSVETPEAKCSHQNDLDLKFTPFQLCLHKVHSANGTDFGMAEVKHLIAYKIAALIRPQHKWSVKWVDWGQLLVLRPWPYLDKLFAADSHY